MRNLHTIINSSESGIATIGYPAFVVRQAVKASLIDTSPAWHNIFNLQQRTFLTCLCRPVDSSGHVNGVLIRLLWHRFEESVACKRLKPNSQRKEGGRILHFSDSGVKVLLRSQWQICCGCILMYTIVQPKWLCEVKSILAKGVIGWRLLPGNKKGFNMHTELLYPVTHAEVPICY